MSNPSKARASDVDSTESIIAIDYELISGRANEARDWERWKTLFAPGARLIPVERRADGKVVPNVLSPDEWIGSRTPLLAAGDFYEWETDRQELREGSIAHVWSSYEAARTPHGDLIRRGVNSIQLWNDGTRWWILSIVWDAMSAAAMAK